MNLQNSPIGFASRRPNLLAAGALAEDGYQLPRRHFLKRILWAAGLSAFGILPSGCAVKWSLLPARPISWVMKPLSSAKTEETTLPDGRVRLHIDHDLLRDVTPPMLVWWWRNIGAEMELNGQSYPRYLIWHPIDHIHFEVAKRLADGSVGPGAVFHIVEALGADMKHLIDARLLLQKLDQTGAAVEVRALAQTVLEIRGQFLPREAGTQLVSTMTIGSSSWLGEMGLNSWLVERFFPAERRKVWLKHSVEEIGNLQFFLPDLYRRHARAG